MAAGFLPHGLAFWPVSSHDNLKNNFQHISNINGKKLAELIFVGIILVGIDWW